VFVAGVSALDMCLSNCTWSGDRSIELYPWDAGTDDGITYMVSWVLLLLETAVKSKRVYKSVTTCNNWKVSSAGVT